MTTINKQKFLAELGKLLTFMYEEDRQAALAIYDKMFDDAGDEQALLQALISPTRQAVVVARAYDAKERKLQVEAQSREETGAELEDGEVPAYLLAIYQVYQDAIPEPAINRAPLENQFSLFEDDDASEEEPASTEEDEATAEAEEPLPETPNEEAAEAEDEAAAAPEEVLPLDEDPSAAVDEVIAPLPEAESEDVDEAPAETAEELENSEAEVPVPEAEESETAVEDALSAEEAPLSDADPSPEEIPLLSEEAEDLMEEPEAVMEDAESWDDFDEDLLDVPDRSVRQAKVPLLLLFVLLAIPLTLLGIVILLIPTLFFLALGVGAIGGAIALCISAFSGLPIFADMMIVLGAALILFALGILFLWIALRFVGGLIGGLIHGVVSLGSRWCYKEVSA